MKKVLAILILVAIVFSSCSLSLEMHDEEGWSIFQCGWALNEGQILVQSHDGFKVGNFNCTEGIFESSVTIENVLDREIEVKITMNGKEEWVAILFSESLFIEIPETYSKLP
jgi:hypothetical protein